MKAHPNFSVLLVGTTAGDGDRDYLQLSAAWAAAVRATLITLGIASDRITAKGLGFSDPWHLPDILNGKLIESVATRNRKVVLFDASSEEAKKIIDPNN
jgi:hypothetical protein